MRVEVPPTRLPVSVQLGHTTLKTLLIFGGSGQLSLLGIDVLYIWLMKVYILI